MMLVLLNELGYDINTSKLNSGSFVKEDSTICSLAKKSSSYTFEQVLRGSVSLGKYLSDAVPSVGNLPSPANLSPGSKDYYDGGYTVTTYGSKGCVGNVNAIQLELSSTFRADNVNLTIRAQGLGDAVFNYYQTHSLVQFTIKIDKWLS